MGINVNDVITKLMTLPGVNAEEVFRHLPANYADLMEYARCVDAVMAYKRPEVWCS